MQKEVLVESSPTVASQGTVVVPLTSSQQLPGISSLEHIPGAFMPVKGQCDVTSKNSSVFLQSPDWACWGLSIYVVVALWFTTSFHRTKWNFLVDFSRVNHCPSMQNLTLKICTFMINWCWKLVCFIILDNTTSFVTVFIALRLQEIQTRTCGIFNCRVYLIQHFKKT